VGFNILAIVVSSKKTNLAPKLPSKKYVYRHAVTAHKNTNAKFTGNKSLSSL